MIAQCVFILRGVPTYSVQAQATSSCPPLPPPTPQFGKDGLGYATTACHTGPARYIGMKSENPTTISGTGPYNIKTGVRIPELDGLRGAAILLVVIHHNVMTSLRPENGPISKFISVVFPFSWSGVDLFFVLSGFLIGGILLDQRNAGNYFKTFYIRRVCRIFPLYFSWLTLFIVLSRMFSSYLYQNWQADVFKQHYPNWAYVFFLQNFFVAKTEIFGAFWLTPTWSLAVEEQFYLLLPLIIWLVPVRRLPHVLISLILLTPALRLFLYINHPGICTWVLLPCRTDALLLGVLCAYGVRQKRPRLWLEENQRLLYSALVVLLIGIGYLTTFRNGRDSFEMVFLGFSWVSLFYACLLLIGVTAKKGLLVSVMRFSPLRRLGIIAYGVFIMHMAINQLAHGLILGRYPSVNDLPGEFITLLAFVVTLLMATLSWHIFEKPIIGWGHLFSYSGKNSNS